MNEPTAEPKQRGLFRSLGPAIIIASVVLGPGSILTSSKVGVQFGYSMVWVLAAAGILMVSMTALGARLGVTLEGTPCDELARRLGRPAAAFAGLSLFLIAACFQFSNNLGVVAAVEPFLESLDASFVKTAKIGCLLVLNLLIITTMFGVRGLYKQIERLMMLLVFVMMLGFAVNLFMARPSLGGIIGGLVPKLPEGDSLGESIWPLLGLFATTFSVGAAFYQCYLVREKGWTIKHLKQGLTDSIAGVAVLVGITLIIMATSAAVLHGRIAPGDLKSAADIALQLEPLFGSFAMILFCLGIFAGAFSSFLVNAMVGGVLLTDGFGLGGRMDQIGPKLGTVIVLLTGMSVAIVAILRGESPVNLIIFAQAITVIGVPVLAFSMLFLATRPDLTGERAVPAWLKIMGAIGCLVTVVLAVKTSLAIRDKLSAPAPAKAATGALEPGAKQPIESNEPAAAPTPTSER